MTITLKNLVFTLDELPNDITLVRIEGEVNTASSEDITSLMKHFNTTGRKKVILDLERVTYFNSRALGVLSQGLREMHRGGGYLKLCNLSSVVLKLFEITSLFDVFQVYETIEEAVQSYDRNG